MALFLLCYYVVQLSQYMCGFWAADLSIFENTFLVSFYVIAYLGQWSIFDQESPKMVQ